MNKQVKISDLLVPQDLSIKKVMQIIDHTALSTAFVVDDESRLIGSVSDGDIRRAIINGRDVSIAVSEVMNSNPVCLQQHDVGNRYLVKNTMKILQDASGRCPPIPIVDDFRRPVQLVDFSALTRVKSPFAGKNRHIHRVLVVGGAGFLGSVLVARLLERGYRVRVLDSLLYGRRSMDPYLENPDFELIEGDMRDISVVAAAIKRVNAVINLAAIVGDPACKASPSTTIETNYLANKALAEACKYNQINRFIFASTCSVYGCSDKPVNEASNLNPLSLYTRSKIHSEEGILSLEDENFSPTILRMATLYGYSSRMRFDLVLNTMTKDAFRDGRIVVHGGGTQWRPLLEVGDAANAYIQCLEAPLNHVKGEIFNLGSKQQNCQIIDVAWRVQKQFEDVEVVLESELYDARDYFVSFDKIKDNLGFRPAATLEAAISRIKDALEAGEIEEVDDSRYYNVKFIQDVVNPRRRPAMEILDAPEATGQTQCLERI